MAGGSYPKKAAGQGPGRRVWNHLDRPHASETRWDGPGGLPSSPLTCTIGRTRNLGDIHRAGRQDRPVVRGGALPVQTSRNRTGP